MAGEIAHVVYAARLLTHLEDEVHDPIYWVGNLFPDIRHLGVVSRKRTHSDNISLANLVGPDDFTTGIRVHTWIDVTREKFLGKAQMKEILPWHPFVPHALKLLEDEVLYDHHDDWNLIHRLLQTVYKEEQYYVHESRFIKEWHTVLQKYFAKKPDAATRHELSIDIGLSPNSSDEINNVVEHLRHQGQAIKLLEQFWRHLEDILR